MFGEKQISQITILVKEKANLTNITTNPREVVTLLNSKVDGMTKSFCMLNCGSEILDEILGVGKMDRDMKGIDFYYCSMNKENNFVLFEQNIEFHMTDYMSKKPP